MGTLRYTTNPGYSDLVVDMVTAIRVHFLEKDWGNYSSLVNEFKRIGCPQYEEAYPVVYIAILFTIGRYLFNYLICGPLVNALNFTSKEDCIKFPESLWKTIAYFGTWTYSFYILTYKYDYFTNPYVIWDDWSVCMNIPSDIAFLYYVECGFYLHSIYATLYMDEKRKDFIVMLIHHVLTLTLIIVSYTTSYHKVGILVIFVHDVTDILLEMTKCHVYLKKRNNKEYMLHDHLSAVGFVAFAISWFVFRLYWYPLKVLYSTGVVTAHRAYHRNAALYTFFNVLLWMLLLMDIYWFYFVVIFLYKIATGQLKEVNDTREYKPPDGAKVDKKKN